MTFLLFVVERIRKKNILGPSSRAHRSFSFGTAYDPLTRRIWLGPQIVRNRPKLDLTPPVTRTHEALR